MHAQLSICTKKKMGKMKLILDKQTFQSCTDEVEYERHLKFDKEYKSVINYVMLHLK